MRGFIQVYIDQHVAEVERQVRRSIIEAFYDDQPTRHVWIKNPITGHTEMYQLPPDEQQRIYL